MNKPSSQQKSAGYSLIEVMIAIAILMLAIVAPMTIAMKSIQSSRYTLEQNTAIFLAQETVSAFEVNRNTDALRVFDGEEGSFWSMSNHPCTSTYGCNFDVEYIEDVLDNPNLVTACTETGDNCRLYYNEAWGRAKYRVKDIDGGEESPYTRQVFIEFNDLDSDGLNDELRVRSEVSWDSNFVGQVQSVSVNTTFYDLYRITDE